ncbi:glutathione S-transferase 1-like [Thrips palmi]|uniref:Glutathione S-transferase 1-like n=1 Tax=Thrips palmi TaxID=161013 RepID=A0A6P9A6L3_THRPL|nr:glutathione S-transferase 1-like [Thrips palmi]
MPITLYGLNTSPPVRGVRLAAKAMGIEFDCKSVDVLLGEEMKPEFLKINPHHTVPTIVDGDFVLWDSHAIVTYLGDKTGNDAWYPKDIKKRATLQQRLHYNNSVLFTRFRAYVDPIFYKNDLDVPPERIQRLQDALDLMEPIIHEGGWLVGDHPTIADCCCVASVSTIVQVLPQLTLKPKVAAWLRRCKKELPGYNEVNAPFANKVAEHAAKILREKWRS